MLTDSYHEYLRSDNWKKLRRERFTMVQNRCELCGHASQANHGHHVCYRNLIDATKEDIRCLCKRCHDDVHLVLESQPWIRLIPSSTDKWNCCLKFLRPKSPKRIKAKKLKKAFGIKGRKHKQFKQRKPQARFEKFPRCSKPQDFSALAAPSTKLILSKVRGEWALVPNPIG